MKSLDGTLSIYTGQLEKGEPASGTFVLLFMIRWLLGTASS